MRGHLLLRLGMRVLSGERSVETQGMFGETFENRHRKWTSKVASEQGVQSEVAFPINVACIKHIRYNICRSLMFASSSPRKYSEFSNSFVALSLTAAVQASREMTEGGVKSAYPTGMASWAAFLIML